jgi:hypothetical protein
LPFIRHEPQSQNSLTLELLIPSRPQRLRMTLWTAALRRTLSSIVPSRRSLLATSTMAMPQRLQMYCCDTRTMPSLLVLQLLTDVMRHLHHLRGITRGHHGNLTAATLRSHGCLCLRANTVAMKCAITPSTRAGGLRPRMWPRRNHIRTRFCRINRSHRGNVLGTRLTSGTTLYLW